jgi:hypothetical protein
MSNTDDGPEVTGRLSRSTLSAATGRRHRLTILSRNLRHFEPLGLAVLDPFVALPTTK